MSSIPGLTIVHRLILIFVILMVGFAVLVWAYQRLLNVGQANAALIIRANAFGDLADDIREELAVLENRVEAFMYSQGIRHAEEFFDDGSFDEGLEHITQLDNLMQNPKIHDMLSHMRDTWLAYADAFNAIINAQVLVGLGADSGLKGAVRAAARLLESELKDLPSQQLLTLLLQMRRHEKNFIIENDHVHVHRLNDTKAVFKVLLDKTVLTNTQRDAIAFGLSLYSKSYERLVLATYRLQARIEDSESQLAVAKQLSEELEGQQTFLVEAKLAEAKVHEKQATLLTAVVMVIVGGSIAVTLMLLALELRRSLKRLQTAVKQIASGNLQARTQLTSQDELGQLGQALDNLLNERVSALTKAEMENELLNESIISIIETVARMSQKDLTVKAVVADDVTGTISDALNLMTSETAAVLTNIRTVAQAVEQAASAVREQADIVTNVAAQERRLVQRSAEGLLGAGQAMTQLAQGAQDANAKADTAMTKTRQALVAVTTSVHGIDRIRDIIRETEKRIKRLGERSQEITGAVNLINAIAERTHILALNASMHAASAGEAGRGFAVVADEVQRLAESSQKATSDIATMVTAIREETADALETMNRLIAQVAEGTRQAQEAGQRMRETETTTTDLVQAVQDMAENATKQAQDALELRKQSQLIVRSTEQTHTELQEQTTYTMKLTEYAGNLRNAVAVFQLPT